MIDDYSYREISMHDLSSFCLLKNKKMACDVATAISVIVTMGIPVETLTLVHP